jgi:GTP cyclohydrolase III
VDQEKRFEKIEAEARVTQDSVLLIHNDLKTMSAALTKMANAVDIMANIQTDMRVMEERIESRHATQKSTNDRLDDRLD